MQKKIGLYFGSFNPVHTGHLIIASHLANNNDLKEVWFVVSPQNPFKKETGLLNERHRISLVKLAIEDEQSLKTSDVEFKLPKPSYTIDTLIYLSEKYPEYEFSVIMGSDGFQNIEKWKNYEQIINNYTIYIYMRPGFEVTNKYGDNIIQVKAPLLEISATEIRKNIKAGKSIRYLVTDVVMKEIQEKGYYKSALENPAQ